MDKDTTRVGFWGNSERLPYTIAIKLLVLIFFAEMGVMWLLFWMDIENSFVEFILDSLLLTGICFPGIYVLVVNPLKLSHKILEKTNEELQLRVEERTIALSKTNGLLKDQIIEYKRVQKELQNERDRSQKYLNVANVILVAINEREEVILINHKGCQILGYKEEDILGKNWFRSFLPAAHVEETRTVFRKMIEGDVAFVEYHENLVLTKTGEKRLIAWHNTVLTDREGHFVATLSSGEDITNQRQMEDKLIEREERLRSLLESATDAIIIANNHAEIISWNRGAKTLFGYSEEEAYGANVSVLMPVRYRDAHHRGLEIFKETDESKIIGKMGEFYGLKKNGEEFPMEISIGSWEMGTERYFGVIIRDITERKQAEEKIKEIERMRVLAQIAGATAHGIFQPLTVIMGIAQMQLDTPSLDLRDIRSIYEAGQKIKDIVNKMISVEKYATMPYLDGVEIIDFDSETQ